eukprot:COSAG03_NODE_6846_length_996_cov_4.238573_1_plen_30_part_10
MTGKVTVPEFCTSSLENHRFALQTSGLAAM